MAYCAAEAHEILDKTRVDLVITNNIMPGMTGLEFTQLLKDDYDLDVIITTGYGESCTPEGAIRAGAAGLLYKPIKFKNLVNSTGEGSRQMIRTNLKSVFYPS